MVVADAGVKRKILEMLHDSPIAGHPGQQKTRELISRDFFWYKMTEDVNKYVNGRIKSQQNPSKSSQSTSSPIYLLPKATT